MTPLRQALINAYPPSLDHQPLSGQKRKICDHIQACRTLVMGGLQRQCDHCGYAAAQYHACRDRHCPQCQFRQQLQALPVAYHHVVFTLPHELNGWVDLHPEVIYRLLFHSVWNTLKTFGEDPKLLNGQLGMAASWHPAIAAFVHPYITVVLHT